MIKIQSIAKLVKPVVLKVDEVLSNRSTDPFNVYWGYGNHADIMLMLKRKDENPDKPNKYPLIWFVTPFTERHERQDMYVQVDLRFIIANITDVNYLPEEREDNVYIPRLNPTLQELLNQFEKSKSFQVVPLEFDKENLMLARRDSEGKHLLNDCADVIDLTLKNVLVKTIC